MVTVFSTTNAVLIGERRGSTRINEVLDGQADWTTRLERCPDAELC